MAIKTRVSLESTTLMAKEEVTAVQKKNIGNSMEKQAIPVDSDSVYKRKITKIHSREIRC